MIVEVFVKNLEERHLHTISSKIFVQLLLYQFWDSLNLSAMRLQTQLPRINCACPCLSKEHF